MAAGLAKQGMLPVFAVYSTFLQRGYDQLIHDVALDGLHVVLGVDRAGLVGADGETHHGCFDALFLPQIPGMTVLCPASFSELRTMLRQAVLERKGPVAVRYPRGGRGPVPGGPEPGAHCPAAGGQRCDTAVLWRSDQQCAGGGRDAGRARNMRRQVLKLNQIAPLDEDFLLKAIHADRSGFWCWRMPSALGCVGQRVAGHPGTKRDCPPGG